ncbi:outer membrane usher protein faeD domain protein, partial [Escherichia coli]|nr:outer membrane usher protein faeD domain protein [Escherichia coli]
MCAGKKAVSEPVSSVFFRRAALALAVSAVFASAAGIAGEKLDMSFIQGG